MNNQLNGGNQAVFAASEAQASKFLNSVQPVKLELEFPTLDYIGKDMRLLACHDSISATGRELNHPSLIC